jgi:hypothetical protein
MDLLTTVWQWLRQFGYCPQGLGVVSLLAGISDKVWATSAQGSHPEDAESAL